MSRLDPIKRQSFIGGSKERWFLAKNQRILFHALVPSTTLDWNRPEILATSVPMMFKSSDKPLRFPSSSKVVHWIGPCASFLCLIHCFGFAFLSLLAPAGLSFLPHSHDIEIGALVLSGVFGAISLYRSGASFSLWTGLIVLLGIATVGLVEHHHGVFHVGLVGSALFQLSITIWVHFVRKAPPECCEHAS
jgi:hypothetical protein